MSVSIHAEYDQLIQSRLIKAVNEGDLSVHYQPQFDARSKNLIGFEALCRWHDSELGDVSPAVFIPLAEELGILKQLDLYVIEVASKEMHDFFQQRGETLSLAFNISSALLNDALCCNQIIHIINDAKISPEQIKLEFTEKELDNASVRVRETLNEFTEHGFLLSLASFGVDSTPLHLLAIASFSEIKIAHSSIKNISSKPQNQLLVQTIISLGHSNNNLHVVAEGVEYSEDKAWLINNHCPVLQGFYFEKDLSIDEINSTYINDSEELLSSDARALTDTLFSFSQQTPWQDHSMRMVARVTLDHYAEQITDVLLFVDVKTEQAIGMIRHFEGVVRNVQYSQVMQSFVENKFAHSIKEDRERLKTSLDLSSIIKALELEKEYKVVTEYHHEDRRCSWKQFVFSYLDEECSILSVMRTNVSELYTQAVDDFRIQMRKQHTNEHIRSIVEDFLTAHLTNRDINAAKVYLDPKVTFIGTGGREVAQNRDEFCQIMQNFIACDLTSATYVIDDYKEKALAPNVISAMFMLIMGVEVDSGRKTEIKVRVTLSCRLVGKEWKICTYHNSSPSHFQEDDEFIPKHFFKQALRNVHVLGSKKKINGDSLLVKDLPCAVLGFYMDDELSVHTLNDDMLEILGYFSLGQFEKETHSCFKQLIHPDDQSKIEKVSKDNENYNLRYRVRNRHGNWIWIHTKGRCIETEKGTKALVGVMLDVSDDIQVQNELKRQANYDTLTKVYNRNSAYDLITQHLMQNESGTMLLFDIDNFKYINDTFGHVVGDKVLRGLAKTISSYIRETDIAARLGGDEFIIYLTNIVDADIIQAKVEAIREAFKLLFIDYHEVHALGLSIGGVLTKGRSTFESLYTAADKAMYEIKHAGKSGFVLYN